MDGGRIDDEGQHAGAAGERCGLGRGLVGGDAEVGAGMQLDVLGVREEGPCRTQRVVGRVQDDGCQVEEDTVEQRGEVGVGPHAQPEGRDTALEVGHRLLMGGLGVDDAEVRPDVPVAGTGRAVADVDTVQQVGRAERGDADAVEGRPGQLLPDESVVVLVGQPPSLAEHGGGPASQSACVCVSWGADSASEPCSGSSSVGSSSPPSTVASVTC